MAPRTIETNEKPKNFEGPQTGAPAVIKPKGIQPKGKLSTMRKLKIKVQKVMAIQKAKSMGRKRVTKAQPAEK